VSVSLVLVTGASTGLGLATVADTQLWVTTLAMALARLPPSTTSHAVDPGWVPTRMGGAGVPDDLVEGHRTQAWLASGPEEEIDPPTGGYWHHGAARAPHPATRDADLQQRLLAHLEALTGVHLDPSDAGSG
jgi:hypothetical protein